MKSNLPSASLSLRRLLAALLLSVSLAALSGCIAVAAGAGASAVAYVRGAMETNLNYDYNKVVDASRNAIKDLEFARVSENKDALKAVLVARTPLDQSYEPRVVPVKSAR